MLVGLLNGFVYFMSFIGKLGAKRGDWNPYTWDQVYLSLKRKISIYRGLVKFFGFRNMLNLIPSVLYIWRYLDLEHS